MPPARTVRQRVVNNENDENVVTRVTRATKAKADALGGSDELNVGVVKKALQAKKSTTNTLAGAGAQRKRAALGDVSNVVKNAEQDDLVKDAKKPARSALTSKTTNAGVQKPGKTASTRQPLGLKDAQKKSTAELKRPGSGSGVMGGVPKKRSTSSGTSRMIKEEDGNSENEPPRKQQKVETEERVFEDVKEAVHAEDLKPSVVEMSDDMEIEDLDAEDAGDPLMVSEYAVEIFEYLRVLEQKNMPNADYMAFQDHLTWKKRDTLTDWLIEVHQKFGLLPETYYLAINIIDRFLSRKIVQLDKLQLVGITAMFIASKYEEVMSPHVSNFSYLAHQYTDEEILSAERFVLETLDYDLSYPNPMNFLRRISKADSYDMQTRTLGKYLLEVSCLDHEMLQYPPSQVAAAAMYMARMILDRGEWDPTIAHYAGYTEEEIAPVFRDLIAYCTTPKPKHEAFHNKYANRKYLKASLLVRQWAKRYFPTQREPDNVLGAADIKPRRSE